MFSMLLCRKILLWELRCVTTGKGKMHLNALWNTLTGTHSNYLTWPNASITVASPQASEI